MSTNEFLLSQWPLHWTNLGIAALILAWFAVRWRAMRSGRSLVFLVAALILLLLALDSPLDALADGYLFSAHMLQHLVLLLIIPALLLLAWDKAGRSGSGGIRMGSALSKQFPSPQASPTGAGVAGASYPSKAGQGLADSPANLLSLPVGEGRGKGDPRVATILYHPLVTWLAGVGAMWLWHVPTLCDAATSSPALRVVQTASLLAFGCLFWSPLLGPDRPRRLPDLAGVLYLFTACVGCTLLGIFITFAPVSVCPVYLHPRDQLGILSLVRTDWGITPSLDQQIGGLLMWVPACFIYFCGIIGLLARWYAMPPRPFAPGAHPASAPSTA